MIDKMRHIVGSENVSNAASTLEQHSHDESYRRAKLPMVVVWPSNSQQVTEIMQLCSKEQVSVIPFGTGTGMEGGVTTIKDSVCINLTKMSEITSLHTEDFDVTIQPGVTRKGLNHYLKDFGLWFPVDPGADASLCGMAATGASGTNAVRYGTMKENVMNLEVVLPDGKIINTAGQGRRAKKSSAGYNLTNLFVGSEGTLGIITAATLKLHAMPESVLSAVCFFPSVQDAVASAVNIIQAGIPIARIEYLDERSVMASNKFSALSHPIKPSLFLEFHGSAKGTQEQVEQVEEIVCSNNGSDFEWAAHQEDRNKLWKARHEIYYALLALAPGKKGYSTDVCVPISHLPEAILYTQCVAESSGLPHGIVGHVGDGNFHCLFAVDTSNTSEINLCKDVAEKIGRKSLDLGGTCTGEHGIGLGKKSLLVEEMGEAIHIMKSIKCAIDPTNIMNPEKVL